MSNALPSVPITGKQVQTRLAGDPTSIAYVVVANLSLYAILASLGSLDKWIEPFSSDLLACDGSTAILTLSPTAIGSNPNAITNQVLLTTFGTGEPVNPGNYPMSVSSAVALGLGVPTTVTGTVTAIVPPVAGLLYKGFELHTIAAGTVTLLIPNGLGLTVTIYSITWSISSSVVTAGFYNAIISENNTGGKIIDSLTFRTFQATAVGELSGLGPSHSWNPPGVALGQSNGISITANAINAGGIDMTGTIAYTQQ